VFRVDSKCNHMVNMSPTDLRCHETSTLHLQSPAHFGCQDTVTLHKYADADISAYSEESNLCLPRKSTNFFVQILFDL
jgi:hypothetical protein